MEASKITVTGKTYDMNFLGKTKKTNLRRKLIIELIQSKVAGTLIPGREFQEAGRFSTYQNAAAFVNRMIRDGIIAKYPGDKPKSYYYTVIGTVRVTKPKAPTEQPEHKPAADLHAFISELSALGVQFTLTISNKEG